MNMKQYLTLASILLVALPASAQDPLRLIEDLQHPRYKVRDAAFDELARLGDKAAPALLNALRKPPSPEVRDRLHVLLAKRRPSEFDAHANGWHVVLGPVVDAQTFEATGTRVRSLRLRVAQLNANRPDAPLVVEIRDLKCETIYVRGTISPDKLKRDFAWQEVSLQHVAPMNFGDSYALVFHARNSKWPWAINAVYRDVYPFGRHWRHQTEDFFFHIEYQEGTSVRVGPKTNDTPMKTPINSGVQIGPLLDDGKGLRLDKLGLLPEGRLKELPK
jgi:hypothetical protein